MSDRPSTYDVHPGLEFRTVPAPAEGEVDPTWTAWMGGVSRGFHDSRAGEEQVRRWADFARAHGAVARGAWPGEVLTGDNPMPVATFLSWDGSINVGAGRLLDLRMITDVTVAPTHRRQGLLRTLMAEDLHAAADAGVPLAGLTVSEGSIYGRFGFGVATRLRRVEVDTGPRFAMHAPAGEETPGGRLELVEPTDLWPIAEKVFARHLATVRGAVDRPAFYEPILSGAFDFEEQSANKDSRAVVHVGADGEPDGYAFFKITHEDGKLGVVRVGDMLAPDPAVWLRLWRFLADIDLTGQVAFRDLAVDDPLLHAVADPWLVRTVGLKSLIWLRVLDVVAALEARPWFADGSVVLGVEDPLGIADGAWRVEVRDGRAEVTATGEAPGVRLPVDVLGMLYLGDTTVGALVAAMRVDGDAEALARFAAMADGGPTPYCTTGF